MYKIGLTAILFLALNSASAKKNAGIDSIGVENNNGKKLIIHQIVAKDTYYSIGRRYNVAPKDIMAFNDNKYLQIGVVIKVPTSVPFSGSGTTPVTVENASGTYEHKVKPKENLNAIAEQYGTTVNELKLLNKLSSNNLRIGQVLKVPAKNNEASAATTITNPEKPVSKPAQTADANPVTLVEHTVKPKEFLNKIAEQYGTSIEAIKTANNLSGNNLSIGQKLKIPATKNISESAGQASLSETTAPVSSSNPDGTYTVKTGENIFTIAKQFGITAYQIRKANALDDNSIKPGQVLKLPSNIIVEKPLASVKEKPAETFEEAAINDDDSFSYKISKGETIFTIAKKFNLTAYQIRVANKLKDNHVSVGQQLTIPKPAEARSVNEVSKQNQDINPDSAAFKDPKLRGAPSRYGLSQIEEKGTAVSISDPDLDASKMLVLHRTAPIGTIIKLTNPMTNRTALAKVVGKFTENESTKDVIIVMTKAVADSLGALDKRFICNLTYGVHEPE